MKRFLCLGLIMAAALCGCNNNQAVKDESMQNYPIFTLAWSEYPSWSVFGVASDLGLINGPNGKLGELEKKWKVRIQLKLADYDTCIQMYGSNAVDAVCITNMDALSPCLGRPSTAIMPTSTSAGADACIAVGVESPEQLKKVTVYGLEKSVSDFAFYNCLVKQGLNPAEFTYKNMDPAAAAQALQTNQKGVKAIMVWNPFVLQTLRTRTDAKRLFDSSLIPEQIIDCVVMGNDGLAKTGGEAAANCIADCYYTFNKRLQDQSQADKLYLALGAKFSSLNVEDMKTCCQQTKFYNTPVAGLTLFEGQPFRDTMKNVVHYYVEKKIVPKAPKIGFGDQTCAVEL